MSSPTELRRQMVALLRDLEPEMLTGAAAVTAVKEFAAIEKAAATARMFAAVRVAKTDAWRGHGHASAADWLAAQAGITVREAATQLGTARKAERLAKTKEQMRKGTLSPGQAGAVADAATADPAAEESLLDSAAKDTTADLKAKAAKAKAAATDSATRDKRIHAERSLRTRTDAEGAFCLFLRGPAIDGVRLQALLRPFEEHAFRTGRTDGARDTFENRSYDAFFTMLAWLQAGGRAGAPVGTATAAASGPPTAPANRPVTPPTHDGDDDTTVTGADDQAAVIATADEGDVNEGDGDDGAGPSPATGGPVPGPASPAPSPATSPSPLPMPKRLPGGNNTKVIVRIDHTALARGHTLAGETCEVAGLGPISVSTAKELMADAFLAAVLTKGRDVVNVAHLGRGLNAHQRTAIEAMGLRCSNRVCNRTIALQIDHRHPYVKDQVTKLDNQDPLCPDCHRRKTHHGWHLEPGTGPRRFLPPHGPDGTERGDPDDRDRGTDPPEPADRPRRVEATQPSLC